MSYHSASGGGDWVTVGGFVAFTLQLLRLSIDLIQVATPDDPSSSAKKKTLPPKDVSTSAASAAAAPESTDSSSTYGSVPASTTTGEEQGSGPEIAASNDEDSPLLPASSATTAPDIDEEPRRRKALRVHLLIASYSLLTIWFAVAAFGLVSIALYAYGRKSVSYGLMVLAVVAEAVAPSTIRVTHVQHERTDTAIDADTGQARAAVAFRFFSEPI